jgi:hypothetical protein
MSSLSPSDIQLIEILTLITTQLNRYLTLFIFIFGIIGNILNILALSQRTLRFNPCAYLFLISSISNFISILSGLTSRILSGWSFDLTDTNRYYCKWRAFVMLTSRTIAFWLIIFAIIDRWILSLHNVQHRQMSTLKNVQYSSLFIIILSILLYLHTIYCYESNLLDTPMKCYGKTISCRLLTDLTYACFTILIPLILTIIFGFFTVSNIRHTHNNISSRNMSIIKYNKNNVSVLIYEQKRRWQKTDRYLCRMLFLQVILLMCLTLPQTIHKLYLTLIVDEQTSEVKFALNQFLYNFDSLLSYIASGMPFYIYTLTGGKVFRKALKKLFFK